MGEKKIKVPYGVPTAGKGKLLCIEYESRQDGQRTEACLSPTRRGCTLA